MSPVGRLWDVRDGENSVQARQLLNGEDGLKALETMNAWAGFQALADILTEKYSLDPPLDRRRIRDWWNRGTTNAAGEPFPQPVETTRKSEGSGRTYRWFVVKQVDAWFCRGVPGPFGSGWKFPSTAVGGSAKL